MAIITWARRCAPPGRITAAILFSWILRGAGASAGRAPPEAITAEGRGWDGTIIFLCRVYRHGPVHCGETGRGANPDSLWAWAKLWQNSATSAFLDAYCTTIATGQDLLPPPEQAEALLNAYMLEKALYELLYELNNRPTWLRSL